MEREMYKKDRQLSADKTKEIFEKGHHGILSVNGDDGFPYGVPVNYVYLNDAIYIHSAKYGYKIEALQKNNKVCFSAILNSEILPQKFTAAFESVIAFGTASFVEDTEEKRQALETFIERFAPDFRESGQKFIAGAFEKTAIIKIQVESIKGKAYSDGSWK